MLWESERWPEWWRGVVSVQKLADGDPEGVGSLGRYRWRSRLPYTVEFLARITRVERPHLLEGRVCGELEGVGLWRLFEHGALTAVVYDWRVRTTRPWMNAIAPFARRLFVRNHDALMRWGAEGLSSRLGVPVSGEAVEPPFGEGGSPRTS